MKKALLLLTVAALTASSGCSWFSRETSAVVVSELTDIVNARTSNVGWKRSLGKGENGVDVKLEPSLSGSSVYVAHRKGGVDAVNTGNGQAAWKHDTDTLLSGGPGAGSGLVIVGGNDGELIALDSAQGSERWRAKLSSEVVSVPAAAGGIVLAHTNDGKIFGMDAATGEQRWLFHRYEPTLTLRGTGEPAVDGSDVYAGLDSGKLVRLNLETGRPVWESPVAWASGRTDLDRVVDIDGKPVIGNGVVYVVSFQGDMAAINKKDGSAKWRRSFSSYQGLVFDGQQRIYAADSNGHVWAIDANTGATVWEQKVLAGRQLTLPALAGGSIAVGDLEGYVHWLSPADGTLISRARAMKSPIKARLLSVGNHVIAYGSEGDLASVQAP